MCASGSSGSARLSGKDYASLSFYVSLSLSVCAFSSLSSATCTVDAEWIAYLKQRARSRKVGRIRQRSCGLCPISRGYSRRWWQSPRRARNERVTCCEGLFRKIPPSRRAIRGLLSYLSIRKCVIVDGNTSHPIFLLTLNH